MTDIPHFQFPFQLGVGGHASVLEQDTDDEIVNCVELILSVPIGSLIDEIEFGITDPTFMINPPVSMIAAQVREWESRAPVSGVSQPQGQDMTMENIIIQVQTGGVK